jgi:hypothetical protein
MESSVLKFLAFAVSIAAVLIVPVDVFLIARGLMNRPIKKPRVELRPLGDLPQHLSTAFAEQLAELHLLGFREDHCLLSLPIVADKATPAWTLHCRNDEIRVTAVIQPPLRPGVESSEVTLYSRDRTGDAFSTLSFQGHLHVKGMPGWTFHDTYTHDLRKNLRLHLQKRTDSITEPTMLESPESLSESQQFLDQYVDFLNDAGWTHQISENEYRFKVLPAFRLALRVFVGEYRRARKRKQ